MDFGKGVRDECYSQAASQCMAYGIGRAVLGILGWAQAALVLCCAALAFGAWAPKAFAAQSTPDMVIDGNLVGDNAGSKGYMCVYCSPYTATLELICHYSDIIQIDQEKYNKLVKESNGFGSAMARWEELTGAANEEPENSWLGGDGFIDGWLILAGKGNCWYATFTDAQISAARSAFEDIMGGGSGGSSGGGSGGSVEDDYLEFEVSCYETVTYRGVQFEDGEDYRVVVPVDSNLSTFIVDDDYLNVAAFSDRVTLWRIPPSWPRFIRNIYSDGKTSWVSEESFTDRTSWWSGITLDGTWTYDADSKTIRYSSGSSWSNITLVTNGNGSTTAFCFLNRNGDAYHLASVPSTYPSYMINTCWLPLMNLNADYTEPHEPDVPLPDPPKDNPQPPKDAPTPPDLPEPKDPTVPREPTKPDPPTDDPGIHLPNPTVVIAPTNTTPQDYTPWLEAIFNELVAFHSDMCDWLQDILDALDDHCLHLREEMATQGDYIGECLGAVQDELSAQGELLFNTLWECAEWLSEYFDSWGEWLVDHIDWDAEIDVEPYDDTSLLYWLKMIYVKLGGGGEVNTRPTDPTTDPIGTDNWLNRLWQNFLTALRDLLPSDMLPDFNALKGKFPFSAPWDILAVLTLLVAPAQTPQFTMPVYTFDGQSVVRVADYDIDLSPYNNVMGGIRLMLKIFWVVFMLSKTKDFMELIEAVIPS